MNFFARAARFPKVRMQTPFSYTHYAVEAKIPATRVYGRPLVPGIPANRIQRVKFPARHPQLRLKPLHDKYQRAVYIMWKAEIPCFAYNPDESSLVTVI